MEFLENQIWRAFYQELEEEQRRELYQQITAEHEDDGANALRRQLMDNRYRDPKKPDKKVDKGVWEMVVMPAYMHGVVAFKASVRKQIEASLAHLGINAETGNDPVLASAVYWEIRNIARRFYATCQSPQYGRKWFGMQESSWDEKQMRAAKDVCTMAELVPETFGMKAEMEIFSRAVVDEFYEVSKDARKIYEYQAAKTNKRIIPFIIG